MTGCSAASGARRPFRPSHRCRRFGDSLAWRGGRLQADLLALRRLPTTKSDPGRLPDRADLVVFRRSRRPRVLLVRGRHHDPKSEDRGAIDVVIGRIDAASAPAPVPIRVFPQSCDGTMKGWSGRCRRVGAKDRDIAESGSGRDVFEGGEFPDVVVGRRERGRMPWYGRLYPSHGRRRNRQRAQGRGGQRSRLVDVDVEGSCVKGAIVVACSPNRKVQSTVTAKQSWSAYWSLAEERRGAYSNAKSTASSGSGDDDGLPTSEGTGAK